MDLSIIIPAYNAEQYIETCLLSVCDQDMDRSRYEIIVVDDGSTDATQAIVHKIAASYPNIVLKEQENCGNGGARNAGAALAKGTYIYFLDADDFLIQNSLGRLVQKMESKKLDMLGFKSIPTKTGKIPEMAKMRNKDTEDEVLRGYDFIAKYNYQAEVWWYIINKDFYESTKMQFYNRRFIQDSYFTPTLFCQAKRVLYVDETVHVYRKSPNSISRKKSKKHLLQHFTDMEFAISKLHDLHATLSAKKEVPLPTLKRIQQKRESYVFIFITRFIKSDLDFSLLLGYFDTFSGLRCYPMDSLSQNERYRLVHYRLFIKIYNNQKLLKTFTSCYRLFRF